jgi:hypothetical protein
VFGCGSSVGLFTQQIAVVIAKSGTCGSADNPSPDTHQMSVPSKRLPIVLHVSMIGGAESLPIKGFNSFYNSKARAIATEAPFSFPPPCPCLQLESRSWPGAETGVGR